MRLGLAVACALLVIGAYIALLWAFVRWIWPLLPTWAMLLVFLALAVLVIGSPITALRVYNKVRGRDDNPP
ncbi:MAG: hypothetical protein JJU06_17390 [Ectothiorhodospiraceae bacterium]|nr:hypothetical protein [Ectothiorhodospiraceae bacterium]MCH8503903.1 hypothetical protein [Ectothiorhodospiraceae bacterium]